MSVIIGSVQLGLLFALMAIGVYISFRILNIPDLSVDGSFTLGLAVSAVLSIKCHPYLGIFLALLAGALAGLITGLLHTKLKIHAILSGILTMTALYSINLYIMGSSANLSLMGAPTLFSQFTGAFSYLPWELSRLLLALLLAVCVTVLLILFFKTKIGLSIRATGDNEAMVLASSINPDVTKCIALSVSNASVALAGAFIAQYQNFADISSGRGMIIIGLASVIIGEAILGKHSVSVGLISAAIGSIVYRIIIALALSSKLFPAIALKLISAIIVVIALSLPVIRSKIQENRTKRGQNKC